MIWEQVNQNTWRAKGYIGEYRVTRLTYLTPSDEPYTMFNVWWNLKDSGQKIGKFRTINQAKDCAFGHNLTFGEDEDTPIKRRLQRYQNDHYFRAVVWS